MGLVIDCQIFPSIDFIKKGIESKHIIIESYEYFKKSSFRNRYVIAGANGLINLTVPVAGGREQKKLITEVEIDNTLNWRTKHWRSIESSYNKAPFFDYYREEIKSLIFLEEEKLFSFNIFILNSVHKMLGVNTSVGFTKEYKKFYEDNTDLRNKLLPGKFQANQDNWQPKYAQVFQDRLGFQPNLSILDLLFCEGPNSSNLIERSIV
ncbi:WbqC family protein [Segetibacter aerophilus]|uniref:WbqC-like protein n=1 Tax=Segetibacter aerophilus TaxID=670293 RepID=A0A512B858_9BACT|nr:WbqC family protein [Segetibacter aerophilus]GEO08145.1 hypothetical protein SAE01_06410 [Segetibacter aerophilus]